MTREVDPGQPAPLQPQALPCSSGVTFVATSVLGKARYLRTGFYMMQAFLFALIAMFLLPLIAPHLERGVVAGTGRGTGGSGVRWRARLMGCASIGGIPGEDGATRAAARGLR